MPFLNSQQEEHMRASEGFNETRAGTLSRSSDAIRSLNAVHCSRRRCW